MRRWWRGGEGEEASREKLIVKEEESFHSGGGYFTLWSGTSGHPGLLFIAFISAHMEKEKKNIVGLCLWLHICEEEEGRKKKS